MLKPIQAALAQRHATLQQNEHTTAKAQRCVREFVQERYPKAVVEVLYQERQRCVVVKARGKALAGELLLQAIDLRAHLRTHGVRVERVIIQ
ncbi:MAG: hypothetical protein IT406_02330 [Candidatus Yanofskybacteria bacterium]|nr:hypothetical protein [Candidatus Yanofskybacteria bacterium]